MICPDYILKAFKEKEFDVVSHGSSFEILNSDYLPLKVAYAILKEAGVYPIMNYNRLINVEFTFIPYRIPDVFYCTSVAGLDLSANEVWTRIENIRELAFINAPDSEKRGRVLAPVIEFFNPCYKKGKALDLGSGFGANAIPLAKSGWEVTCVEIDAHLLEDIKTRNPAIECVEGDITKVELKKNHYDLVVVAQVFPFLRPKTWRETLRKIFEALTSQGQFVGTFFVRSGPMENMTFALQSAHALPDADLIPPMLKSMGFINLEVTFKRQMYNFSGCVSVVAQKP